MPDLATNVLYYGDNLDILRRSLPDAAVDLVYLDPPFNSNRDDNVIFRDESGKTCDAQLLAFEDTSTRYAERPDWLPPGCQSSREDAPERLGIRSERALISLSGFGLRNRHRLLWPRAGAVVCKSGGRRQDGEQPRKTDRCDEPDRGPHTP